MIETIIAVRNSPFAPFGVSPDELSEAIKGGYVVKRGDSYKLTAKGRAVYAAYDAANPNRFEST